MTAADPDAVRALAEAMHRVQYLPGTNPYHRYSDGHRQPELRRAALILAVFEVELAARGLAIGPISEQIPLTEPEENLVQPRS